MRLDERAEEEEQRVTRYIAADILDARLNGRSVYRGSRVERWNVTRLRTRVIPFSKGDARETEMGKWI